MATIGLDSLYYAPIAYGKGGNETYGAPVQLAKAMTASLSVEIAEGTLYADDALSEKVSEFKGGKLSLGIDDIGKEAAKYLTGATVDSNGVLVASTEDVCQGPSLSASELKNQTALTGTFGCIRSCSLSPAQSLQLRATVSRSLHPRLKVLSCVGIEQI